MYQKIYILYIKKMSIVQYYIFYGTKEIKRENNLYDTYKGCTYTTSKPHSVSHRVKNNKKFKPGCETYLHRDGRAIYRIVCVVMNLHRHKCKIRNRHIDLSAIGNREQQKAKNTKRKLQTTSNFISCHDLFLSVKVFNKTNSSKRNKESLYQVHKYFK